VLADEATSGQLAVEAGLLSGVLTLAAWSGLVLLGWLAFGGSAAPSPSPPTYPQNSAAEAAVKGARARPPQGVDGRHRSASIGRRAGGCPRIVRGRIGALNRA